MNAPDSAATARLISTMRVGFTGGMHPAPQTVPPDGRADWQLDRSAALGATCLQVTDLPAAPAARRDLRAKAADLDIELEGLARALFTPLGQDPRARLGELRAQLEAAREAGLTVVRHGWGRLTLATTRYSPARDSAAQQAHIVDCLTTAATVASDVGVPIAVENHCDFLGEELAAMLREVASPFVGAALDTANGFAAYTDPARDAEALAPLALTTHIKDMRMIANPVTWAIPLIPVGCRLGKGNVDWRAAIVLLAERSPHAEGLHLIVEAGWEPEGVPEAEGDPLALRREILEDGVRQLLALVASHRGEGAER